MINSRKILYIYNAPLQQVAGADRVNIRNGQLLSKTTHFIVNYEIRPAESNKVKTLYNLLRGYCCGIRKEIVSEIITIIKSESIEIVFLCSSKIGVMSRILSNIFPKIKIITFFHNIEKQYGDELLKTSYSIKNKFINRVIEKNEQYAISYSNFLITMNQRDNHLLSQLYNKNSDLILPLGFTDIYCKECYNSKFDDVDRKLNLLFVGSAFFANINGLTWFINKVFPHLHNVEINIIGKNMNQYFSSSENKLNNTSINVVGYVENLTEVYDNAHVVISPIFDGGGMKTKTAEAMMYGCPIIGTKEAFQGYDLDFKRIGALCNTAIDFISAINSIRKSREELVSKSQYARFMFLKYYETNALVSKVQHFIDCI